MGRRRHSPLELLGTVTPHHPNRTRQVRPGNCYGDCGWCGVVPREELALISGMTVEEVDRANEGLIRAGWIVSRAGPSGTEYHTMLPEGHPAWDELEPADAEHLRAVRKEWGGGDDG